MSGFNDFMDKAGLFAAKAAGKAKELAGAAAEKTKEVSRVARLNMDISSKRDAIKKAYAELGKLYYEAHKLDPEEAFAPACQQIDEASAAIAAMEAEIEKIKADGNNAQDADFASVVDATEAEADVTVEVTVEEESSAEVPVEAVEAEVPVEPEKPTEPVEAEKPAAPEPPTEE